MDTSLRNGLMAALERIATEPGTDWYMAFRLLRASTGLSRDPALDDAFAKALFALEVRNTATCAQCLGMLKRGD